MITTALSFANFNGSGSAGPFTFPFIFFANSDIVVTRGTATQTEGVGYTLTGAGTANGGSITLGTALAVGETLNIRRIVQYLQPVQFANQGAFYPETHERAFDRCVMMMQQIKDNYSMVEVVTAGAGGAATVVYVDASLGDTTINLPAFGEVLLIRDDDSANIATIMPAGSDTVLRQESITIDAQDEAIRLLYHAGNWQRI